MIGGDADGVLERGARSRKCFATSRRATPNAHGSHGASGRYSGNFFQRTRETCWRRSSAFWKSWTAARRYPKSVPWCAMWRARNRA
jgi:hypothetical protein